MIISNATPMDFDWDEFTRQGEGLTARIEDKLMQGYSIYYEPSDDREFFKHDDCDVTMFRSDLSREQALRERKLAVVGCPSVGNLGRVKLRTPSTHHFYPLRVHQAPRFHHSWGTSQLMPPEDSHHRSHRAAS